MILVSSEYLNALEDGAWARRSSVCIEKIEGPPTVPCEHPSSIGMYWHCFFLQISRWNRLMMKS